MLVCHLSVISMESMCPCPTSFLTIARNCTIGTFLWVKAQFRTNRKSVPASWNAVPGPQIRYHSALPLPGWSTCPQVSRGQSPHELQTLLKKGQENLELGVAPGASCQSQPAQVIWRLWAALTGCTLKEWGNEGNSTVCL